MAEVSVDINGRKYRMACADGQEEHVRDLARRFNVYVDNFKGSFGEIGDNRLTVMAGIAILDELAEAQRRLSAVQAEMNELSLAGQAMAAEGEEMEVRFVRKLEEATRRIELAAAAIDSAGTGEMEI